MLTIPTKPHTWTSWLFTAPISYTALLSYCANDSFYKLTDIPNYYVSQVNHSYRMRYNLPYYIYKNTDNFVIGYQNDKGKYFSAVGYVVCKIDKHNNLIYGIWRRNFNNSDTADNFQTVHLEYDHRNDRSIFYVISQRHTNAKYQECLVTNYIRLVPDDKPLDYFGLPSYVT